MGQGRGADAVPPVNGVRVLSEHVAYLPAGVSPLSADVGLVHGDKAEWVFDVGSSDEAAEMIGQIGRPKIVVLSHFHQDHTGNLGRVACDALYCGKYTRDKLGRGTAVTEPVTFEDGVQITLFPIPCTHSKGAVGLEVNGEFAFVGDALYGREKPGGEVYNAGLLQQTIGVLRGLKADKLLVSHDPAFVRDKAEVIEALTAIYRRRQPGNPYIQVSVSKN